MLCDVREGFITKQVTQNTETGIRLGNCPFCGEATQCCEENLEGIKRLELSIFELTEENRELLRICEFLREWYEFFFDSAADYQNNYEPDATVNDCFDLNNYVTEEHKRFASEWQSKNPRDDSSHNLEELGVYQPVRCNKCGEFLHTLYCFFCGY